MTCIVCNEAHKYKCIKCFAGYCSVGCYKTHKESCAPPAAPAEAEAPAAPAAPGAAAAPAGSVVPEYEKWLEDPKLEALLAQPTVQHHLKVVANILQDGRLSGESSSEGRRAVAIKKLRELRMGGREKNEAIEEFVQVVLGHMQHASG